MYLSRDIGVSFGTIRNNIALKQTSANSQQMPCFGTIRNNIALKHEIY